MTGMGPAAGNTSNTVHLPKTQMFSPQALTAIMEIVSQGGVP